MDTPGRGGSSSITKVCFCYLCETYSSVDTQIAVVQAPWPCFFFFFFFFSFFLFSTTSRGLADESLSDAKNLGEKSPNPRGPHTHTENSLRCQTPPSQLRFTTTVPNERKGKKKKEKIRKEKNKKNLVIHRSIIPSLPQHTYAHPPPVYLLATTLLRPSSQPRNRAGIVHARCVVCVCSSASSS